MDLYQVLSRFYCLLLNVVLQKNIEISSPMLNILVIFQRLILKIVITKRRRIHLTLTENITIATWIVQV